MILINYYVSDYESQIEKLRFESNNTLNLDISLEQKDILREHYRLRIEVLEQELKQFKQEFIT